MKFIIFIDACRSIFDYNSFFINKHLPRIKLLILVLRQLVFGIGDHKLKVDNVKFNKMFPKCFFELNFELIAIGQLILFDFLNSLILL